LRRRGTELGPTDWLEVTQDRVNLFADATDDHQWIHIDPERAASGPFGGTIAHGLLTLSLLPHFRQQLYNVDNVARAINYGYNKVRFITPVRVGAKVRARAHRLSFLRRGRENPQNLVVLGVFTSARPH
jgi:acyl dehydratase